MTMNNEKIAPGNDDRAVVVPFEHGHVEGGWALSQELKWPYRIEDWAFATVVGQGFALVRHGKVLGSAMWWAYGDLFASAGMIIVTASAQGHGYGARLFDTLLEAAGNRTVLLNSTEEGMPLYLRRGFTPWGKVFQQQGPFELAVEAPSGDLVRSATDEDTDTILDLDLKGSGMPRAHLIRELLKVGEGVLLYDDTRPVGYAIARRYGRGYVVGPVVAQRAEGAKLLITALLSRLRGQFVRIDVYEQDGLSGWLEELGLKTVSEAISMARGPLPVSVDNYHTYAVANQAFT
jgi:GNAT superfamily N-acetyltransferase